MVSFPGQSG